MIKVCIVFLVSIVATSTFASEYKKLAKFETQLLSQSLTCEQKQELAKTVDVDVLQELFDRLGEKNVVLRKARERNELMNLVFAYEGKHEWSRDDSRVLHLVFSEWQEMMVPECFDSRSDGLSSKEWLMGAAWAIKNHKTVSEVDF
jgi:hypothetical protein